MSDTSVKLPKPKYGQIVVLQKNGDEPRGHGFPLIASTCVVGRCLKSDIRISSADVSDTHCKFLIDEASGEASLEILGNETEVNGTHFEPVSLIKLNHRDVISVGGRKLRFEYLPPDYKPIQSNPVEKLTDSFNAEVVDMEENGDVVDSNADKEEEFMPEVPCTPSLKRVSFGPYLSPEQFDNTLPPATPVKKGATPRRSTRYSGLKFTRAPIDPLIEEDAALETPAEEQMVMNEIECINETIVSEDAEASISSLASVDETSVLDRTSPLLAVASEFPEISVRANLDGSSIDAMSTMSDVSNIAVVPSECCSFLDEPIEEGDFEVVEQEDTSLFADDLIGGEIPVPDMTAPRLTNGTNILRSFTTSSLVDNMGDEEEEGITLSPDDMAEVKICHSSIVESFIEIEQVAEGKMEETKEESLVIESSIAPSSPQADYTDVRGVKQLLQTPKPTPVTPKADYTNVEGVKQLLKTPKISLTASSLSPQADYSDVEGVKDLLKTPKLVVPEEAGDLPKDVTPAVEPMKQVEVVSSLCTEKLIETPESSPSRKSPETIESPPADSTVLEGVKELLKTPKVQAPQTPKDDDTILHRHDDFDRFLQTPKADNSKLNSTDLEGVARLLETPKSTRTVVVAAAAVGKTPQADYTDVRGIKKLLQTPKPPPNTPKADYTNVSGVKRLLRTPKVASGTPKADYTDVEGVDFLMKTPKPKAPMIDEEEVPEKIVEQSTPEASIVDSTEEIVSHVEEVVVPQVDEEQQLTSEKVPEEIFSPNEAEVEKEEVTYSRRGTRTPKTATPKIPSKRTPSPSKQEEQLVEEKERSNSDEPSVVTTSMEPEESAKVVSETEQVVEEEPVTASAPKRGRSAAISKTNTPKADYTDVSGEKRLLRTPRAAPGTPKADYSEVEGVDLLMKTPKAKDVAPLIEEEGKDVAVVAGEVPEKIVLETVSEVHQEPSEAGEEPASGAVKNVEENPVPAPQVDEIQSVVQEEPLEKETTPPKRARRAAAVKTNTPKADYSDVRGVKRLLKTPRAAPGTPKADYSDVEGVDLLMKTPKPKDSVPEIAEEEKEIERVVVEEEMPEKIVLETVPEAHLESSESVKEPVSEVGKNVEENPVSVPQMDEIQPVVQEELVEKETTPPKRARRAAAVKTNTPKADYSDVRGVKRLLKTPKAAPGTPKADYTNVEGVDLLMKTPKPKEPVPEIAEEEKEIQRVVVEEEMPEKIVLETEAEARLDSTETNEKSVNGVSETIEEKPVSTPQMDEVQPVVEEATNKDEPVEEETTPPKRSRRNAAAKTNTPKVDSKDVRGAKKRLKSSTAASSTSKDDNTNAEGVDLLVKTHQAKAVKPEGGEVVAEESLEKPVEETTSEAVPLEIAETTEKSAEENPVSVAVASEEQSKESEVETETIPTRRSRRAPPTPKTNTPKPAGRPRRKQPQSEPEIQPEVNEIVEVPASPTTDKEVPTAVQEVLSEETSPKAEEVEEVSVKTVSTPKRGRRPAAAPASKVETPKATRLIRGKRQSESDGGQAESEVENRPLRSKKRQVDLLNDEKLSLSPVVRLRQINLPSTSSKEVTKMENKRDSSSSNEEVAPAEVKPVRRGRGRQAKEVVAPVEKVEKKTVARRGRLAAATPVPAAEEPIPSADEMEEVEAKPAKKATRRAASKQTAVAEKAEGAPEEKRRRGGSKPGLDDVEMLHEGKGHAADIHANHMPDDETAETNDELTATTSSARSTRGKKASLKVHFEGAEAAAAAASPLKPIRSTRKTAKASPSGKKVSVRLERDPEIESLATVSGTNEDEEKVVSATKRSRQKKVPAAAEAVESPAVPSAKRTRGVKKVSTESDVPKVENSSPPPAAPSPRRTRRTRNI